MKLVFFTYALLCIYACTKTDFKYNNFQSKLFVQAIFDTKLGLELDIIKSANPLEAADSTAFNVKNSKIFIYENGKLLFSSDVKGKKYVNNALKPKENAKYAIKVESDVFEPVYSDTLVVPSAPVFSNVKVDRIEIVPDATGSATGRAYISLDVTKKEKSKEIIYTANSMENERLLLNEADISGCFGEVYYLVANSCFINDIMHFKGLLPFDKDNKPKFKTVLLSTSTIDYYNYYQSFTQPLGLEWLFAEAKPSYSNMHGGYGVFLVKNTVAFNIYIK